MRHGHHHPLNLVGQRDACAWCFETWPCTHITLESAVTALREIADCHFHGPDPDDDSCEVCRVVVLWLEAYDEERP